MSPDPRVGDAWNDLEVTLRIQLRESRSGSKRKAHEPLEPRVERV